MPPMTYQLTNSGAIIRLEDQAVIPQDPANRDYVKFLQWKERGNEPLSAPLQPDYLGFWDKLLASSVYGSIRQQAMSSLPMNTLATEFIALIGDAKAGRANESAIQASMAAILATGTFSPSLLGELQTILEASNLDSVYALS